MGLTEHEVMFLERNKEKAIERLAASASKYVLVKRFHVAQRAGLRVAIEEGNVEIIETCFGKAYSLKE